MAKVKPVIFENTTKVPVPEFPKSGRGGKSTYPFDTLKVGGSFGIKNRTANQMASTISSANKRNRKPEMKEGKPVYTEVKDKTGKVVSKTANTVPGAVFKAMDVDPVKDPDGATCRVWRLA